MIGALIITLAANSQYEPLPFPTEEMVAANFEVALEPTTARVNGNQPFREWIAYGGPKIGGIQIQAVWTKNPGQDKEIPFKFGSEEWERFRKMLMNQAPKNYGTFSGNPPHTSGFTQEKRWITFHANTQWASVYCLWNPPFVDIGTNSREPAPYNEAIQSAFTEKVARKTLIRAVGLRLDPSGTKKIADSEVASAKCRLTQAKFSDLTKWAELNGWKIGDENDYGIITLKKGEVECVLPLGADQIKVKGAWKEMGDSAAFFKGKLYLPEAGLKHLQEA
jgi:hypothetical protein